VEGNAIMTISQSCRIARRLRPVLRSAAVAAVAIVFAGCGATSPATAPASTGGAAVTGWIAATALPLHDHNPSTPLDDRQPLARSIGAAQVVGLGESVHGVAEEINVKHRLLRLLVERLGFRSIAWEEDWTISLLIDDYIGTGTGDLGAIMAQLSPQWQSRQVAEVLRWLRAFNAERPDKVRFVGVEYYLTRASGYDAVQAYVARTAPGQLAQLRTELQPISPDTSDIVGFVQTVMNAPDKAARLDHARRALRLVESLPHTPADPDHDLAVHHAAQIAAFYEHYSLPDADALVYRDAHAAQNLRWWRDRTGDKIAYWAATPHTANAPRLRIGGPPGPELRFASAGSYLRRWYGPGYVSLDVTVGHGAASLGPGQNAPLPEPGVGQFERPLAAVGLPLYVLDLHQPAPPTVQAWLSAPAVYRGLPDRGPDGFLDGGSPAEWFDVVVHVQTATPAAPL
jgi:erythromycin esterase-like protein